MAGALRRATQQPAVAQGLSQVCQDINNGGLDAPFVPGGNSTTLVVDDDGIAGEEATIEWLNGVNIEIKLNNAVVHTSNASSGSFVVTLTTGPSVGIIVAFDADPLAASGSVDSSCSAGGTTTPPPTPPTTPTAGPAADTAAVVDGALSDQDDDERERVEGFFDDMLGGVPPEEYLRHLVQFYAAKLAEARTDIPTDPVEEGIRENYIDFLENELAKSTRLLQESIEGVRIFDAQGVPFSYSPGQSRIYPSVSAISRYFDFGGNTVGGNFPLQSTIPGWTFNIDIRGAIIDRTFAALNRQTWVGSATLSGAHRLDTETVLGLGIKLGGARSTQNTPASTVNSAQIGADLAIVRMLSPDLFGGVYFGYEFGAHQATISGVDSNFVSHTIKAGGTLRGEMTYGDFLVTRSVSALLQYRHRPSFTDAAAVLVPSSDTIDVDVRAGATISRDFDVPEKDLMVTPFLGANLLLDYTQTTPALVGPVIPGDPFKFQLLGGVRVRWDGGATASLQADISRGANTTTLGVRGSVSVPIQ